MLAANYMQLCGQINPSHQHHQPQTQPSIAHSRAALAMLPPLPDRMSNLRRAPHSGRRQPFSCRPLNLSDLDLPSIYATAHASHVHVHVIYPVCHSTRRAICLLSPRCLGSSSILLLPYLSELQVQQANLWPEHHQWRFPKTLFISPCLPTYLPCRLPGVGTSTPQVCPVPETCLSVLYLYFIG